MSKSRFSANPGATGVIICLLSSLGLDRLFDGCLVTTLVYSIGLVTSFSFNSFSTYGLVYLLKVLFMAEPNLLKWSLSRPLILESLD